MTMSSHAPARALTDPVQDIRAAAWSPSEGLLPCAYRHLAIAAGALARTPSVPAAQTARYAAVEARCRSLTDDPCVAVPQPVVAVERGLPIPLADLLGDAWWRHRWFIPERGVHPEMVQAAEQLLQELAWYIPG